MNASPLSRGDVRAVARRLRAHATRYVPSDWNYTRRHNIVHIRRRGDFSGYHHPVVRVRRAVSAVARLVTGRSHAHMMGLGDPKPSWLGVVATIRVALSTRRHLPDGVLDDGGVITVREETGEYLQYVQPSVGALLADLIEAHPGLPQVQALAAEIIRIEEAYTARVANGEVD